MVKSFKEKHQNQGCLKRIGTVVGINVLYLSEQLLVCMCYMVQLHIKVNQGCRSSMHWISATCFNPFLASLIPLFFFKTFYHTCRVYCPVGQVVNPVANQILFYMYILCKQIHVKSTTLWLWMKEERSTNTATSTVHCFKIHLMY